MNLETVFQEYGLKESHVKIYLACLELGSAPILKISQKAGVARSSCEVILESLQKQGFVSSFRKKRVKYFNADDPHNIIKLTQNKTRLLENALPELMSFYGKAKIRPTIRYYEGKSGMGLIFDEILKEADEVLGFSPGADLFLYLNKYHSDFLRERIARKIPTKVILPDSELARERQRLGPGQLREVRIFRGQHDFHGLIYIWGNKIALFSFESDLGAFVIESPALVQAQRVMFNLIWQTLPPAPKF